MKESEIMRGISFNISKPNKSILATIFSGVECEKFWWHISEDEIYNKIDESIFKESYIDGKAFIDIINTQNYHVICANIKAYPLKILPISIETYEDFLKSECQLNLLCFDVFYYEIYSKNNSILEEIQNNASKNGFSNIEYITHLNDQRAKFSVK